MNKDLVVSQLNSAWNALQKAKTVQDTKKVLDVATAAGIYAKRQGLSDDIIGAAHSIRIFALRQLGEMLKATPRSTGYAGPGRGKKGVDGHDRVLDHATLKDLSIDRDTSSLAQRIAELPARRVQAIAERRTTIEQVKRDLKEQKRESTREENRELTKRAPAAIEKIGSDRYQTIVLDPPWDWGDEGDADQLGRSRPTYGTMSIEEIADPEKVPVAELADKNAHLYLWITNRSLPKGFGLIEKWGFRYVTMLTWVKPSFGMGNYYRGSTEQVLFAVKGSLSLLRKDLGTHFFAERAGPHSTKPPEFYAMVETASPGPWIEMFARQMRPGWTSWGAEVNADQAAV